MYMKVSKIVSIWQDNVLGYIKLHLSNEYILYQSNVENVLRIARFSIKLIFECRREQIYLCTFFLKIKKQNFLHMSYQTIKKVMLIQL